MNNFEYANIDDIKISNQPIRGSRFNISKDRRIIVPVLRTDDNSELNVNKDSFEMHVFYPDGGYITSLYDIRNWTTDDELNPSIINLNVYNNLNSIAIQPGTYKLVYNFLRNQISSEFNATKLFIAEMSNDRRELVLSLTDPNDRIQVTKLKNFVLEYMKPKTYFPSIVLNFGENKIIDVINITSDGNETYFYVKLYYPLPSDLDVRYECWLSSQIMKPYIETIKIESLLQTNNQKNKNTLRGPNYNADYKFNAITETDFKSWNDLLSTNLQTSQEILNKVFNKKEYLEQIERKNKENRDNGIDPYSLLTKENLECWINQGKSYMKIAREFVGLSDTIISESARKFHLKSAISLLISQKRG